MGYGRSRRALGLATVSVMAVALAGCWTAPGQGPGRQSHNPFESVITVDSVASLAEAWTVDTGEAEVGAPVVSSKGVVARGGTIMYTLAPADGHEVWRFDGSTGAPTSTMSDPIFADGRIFVGYGYPNLGGRWYAKTLDAATGAPVTGIPAGLVDGVRGKTAALSYLAFGSGGPGAIFISVAGDIDDSATYWDGLVVVSDLGVWSMPTTLGANGVYHGGVGLVTTTPGAAPQTGNGVRRFGIAKPGNCYTGSTTTFFPCPQWATPVDGTYAQSPVIDSAEETVYTGTDAGTVYALDAASGAIMWSAPAGAGVTESPALADGTLFVPTADGDLVAFDAATGAMMWSAPTGGEISVQPAVAGGVVYTGSTDGSLHGFPAAGCGAATCTPLWSAATGSPITGDPAVTGGRLYVGTQDGRLIAYAPAGG